MSNLLRYADSGDTWTLTAMGPEYRAGSQTGLRDQQPDWLREILTVARIGGHLMGVPHPPPIHILWFRVDDNLKLVSFETIDGGDAFDVDPV